MTRPALAAIPAAHIPSAALKRPSTINRHTILSTDIVLEDPWSIRKLCILCFNTYIQEMNEYDFAVGVRSGEGTCAARVAAKADFVKMLLASVLLIEILLCT